MASADSWTAVRGPHDPLSPAAGTPPRPPEVSTAAFATHLPDLQPWPLMDMDFAIIGPLVRPNLPHIRFLSVRSWLCSTLPPDPASRRRPCAQLHPSPPSGWVEDFHLQAVVHARHTKKGGPYMTLPKKSNQGMGLILPHPPTRQTQEPGASGRCAALVPERIPYPYLMKY
jgi:hypothetical protein